MTNGKDFAEWAADYGFTDEQTNVHQYALRVARDAWDKALSVCADGGKDSSAAALDALKRAERFIVNGTEFGYIRMPDAPDPALDTLPAIRKAIAAIAKEKK